MSALIVTRIVESLNPMDTDRFDELRPHPTDDALFYVCPMASRVVRIFAFDGTKITKREPAGREDCLCGGAR